MSDESTDRETKPRRRRRWPWIPVGFLALVLLGLLTPFFAVRFAGPRNWMLDQGLGAAVLDEGTRIRVESVKRLDPAGARLTGVELSVRDSLGRWTPWARVSEIETDWNFTDLVFGRYRLGTVRVESLAVNLSDSLRPALRAKREDARRKGGAASATEVTCGRFSLGRVVVRKNGEPTFAAHLVLSNVRYTGGRLGFGLDSLSVESVETGSPPGAQDLWLALSSGNLRLLDNGSMDMDDLLVRGPGLAGRAWMRRSTASADTAWHVTLRLDPVRPEGVLAALGASLPEPFRPVPGDSLAGFVDVFLDPADRDAVEGRFEFSGTWAGRPAEVAGAVRRTGDGWSADEIHLRRPDGEVVLTGHADPSVRNATGEIRFANLNIDGEDIPWDESFVGATRLNGAADYVFTRDGPDWSFAYDVALDPSRVRSWSLLQLQARGRVTPQTFTFDSLRADVAGGSIEGFGSLDIPSDSLDATFYVDNVPALILTERDLSPPVVGRVSGDVHLVGAGKAWRATGSARGTQMMLDEVRADIVEVPEFDLVFPEVVGHGRAQVQGMRAGPVHVALAHGDFDKRAGGLSVQGAGLVEGRNVTYDAILISDVPGEGPNALAVRSLRIDQQDGVSWRSDGPFRLSWDDNDGVRLDGLSLSSPTGELTFSGVRRPDDTVEASLAGSLELRGALSGFLDLPDSTWGAVRVEATAAGPLRDPKLDATFSSDSILIASWPARAISGSASWDAGELELRDFRSEGPWGRIEIPRFRAFPGDSLHVVASRLAAVDYDWIAAVPWQGTCDLWGLHVGWLASKTEAVLPDVEALTYENISPVTIESIIRIVRPQESVPGQRFATRFEGLGNVSAAVAGTPGSPVLDVACEAWDVGYHWSGAEYLAANMTYRERRLDVRSLHWNTAERSGEVSGTLPLVLSLAPPVVALSETEDIDLSVRIPRASLAILDPLSEALQEPRGEFRADLRVTGRFPEPVLGGTAEVTGASLRVPLREERVRDINARLEMDEQGVHIRSLKGRIGPEGTVEVTGYIRTLEDMDMQVKLRKGTFFETGVYRVVGDADVRVFSQVDQLTQEVRPHVVGTAKVREAQLFNLQPREPVGPPRPDPWIVRVRVEAPSNISVNQTNSRVELGNGNLLVNRRDIWWNISGSIEVQSGWYRVFNNRFTVTQGTLDFRDSGVGLELVSDVVAETEVFTYDQEGKRSEDPVVIQAHVVGPPENMDVDLSSPSDPDYNREELIDLLSTGRLTGESGYQGGQTAEARNFLLTEVAAQLEAALQQEAPFLQRVYLRQGGEDPVVVISPIVGSRYSVNYAQQLSFSPTQEVTLHYRLSNFLFLNAGVLRERMQDGTENEEYNLDLKFRIEYGGGKKEKK